MAGYVFLLPQSHAHKSVGDPLALMGGYGIVDKERVVGHAVKSDEVARGEIIDDGEPLVEKHVELHPACMLALVVNGQLVAIIYDEGGK